MVEAIYFAIASAAGAIGAVIGFGLQIRSLRKAQLEIEELQRKATRAQQESEKLRLELENLAHQVELSRLGRERAELEIGKLRRESEPKSRLVTEISTDEVVKYADIRFSRQSPAPAMPAKRTPSSRIIPTGVVVGTVAALVVVWFERSRLLAYVVQAISTITR